MITNLPKAELATIGARYRAAYLVPQAGYTLGIADADGPPLSALLPSGFLAEAAALRNDVDKARQDKTIAATEAKHATSTQNDELKAAKVWRQQVVNRASRAVHMGGHVPSELTVMGSPRTVAGALDLTSRLIGLLTENTAVLATSGPDIAPLIAQGRQIYQSLQSADNDQEVAHSSNLPAAVAAFAIKKGELYTALKIINEAGHELFANDPQASARYNLSILYRRGSSSAATPVPSTNPTNPAAPPPSATK
jgi:hypothetical protein